MGDAEQIEAWEHDEWLLMQDMGDDYYKLHRRYDQDSEEEDPFEAEGRIEWEEEEEKAKAEYFKMIAGEEERLIQANSGRADRRKKFGQKEEDRNGE